MKIYKVRDIYTSSGIKYVPIPAHWVADAPLLIEHGGRFMKITHKNWTPAWSQLSKDLFGRVECNLCYYVWEPEEIK